VGAVRVSDQPRTCVICGRMAEQGYVVEPAMGIADELLWTRQGEAKKAFYTGGARCRDRQECRNRVERLGSTWPMLENDTVPSGATRPGPSREKAPVSSSEVVDGWAEFEAAFDRPSVERAPLAGEAEGDDPGDPWNEF
jgi:hypothetical protein